MRFVKNLIATAALAVTVVHQGGLVAGLPAGNPGNLGNNQPDTLGKESTVVPGASTTASIPLHTTPGAVITTGTNMVSDPASIFQGVPTSVPVVIPVWETETVLVTHTVAESSGSSPSSGTSTGLVSVTPEIIWLPPPVARQATVDGPQATVDGPQATVDARQATVDGPQATASPAFIWIPPPAAAVDARQATVDGPQATVDGPQATVDGPQATVDGPQATVDARQATVDGPQATVDGPLATASPEIIWIPPPAAAVDARQATVDGPEATVDGPQIPVATHQAQVSYLPKPPTGPGGSHPDTRQAYHKRPPTDPNGRQPHPDALVEARQMLPITSSVPAISQRQMLPITSSEPALSERQMLPITSSVPAISQRQMLPITSSEPALSERQMLPITSSVPAISERQMLPITSSVPAISQRQMLPITSSEPAISARDEAYTSPGTPWGRQPDPNDKVGGAISTVTETSMHTVTATPSSPEVTVTMTETRPLTSSTSATCTSTAEPEVTVTRTKTLSKDSAPEQLTDVPIGEATTITTTTCSHKSCATFTVISTEVVTPSESTYTGGPSTPGADVMNSPVTSINSCTVTTASPVISLTASSISAPPPETSVWTTYPLPTSSEQVTVITQTTHITTTFTPTGEDNVGPVTPTPPMITARDQDPTFSVDPSDLPTMPPMRRDQDPTFSVDPSDLPTMPPARDEQSITLTASFTITITEYPTSTPAPAQVTARDQDPTFSVDPSDLPTMPPAARRDEQEQEDASITTTAPYTITFSEFIPIPTLDPSWSSMFPSSIGDDKHAAAATGAGWVDPPVPTVRDDTPPEAGPLDPKAPIATFTDGPANSHTYTHTHTPVLPSVIHPTTGRPHPTTLVTSMVRSAA